ncbi:C-terminal binding protein [Pseudonocardia sp. TMWB2A]|uniref:C-terminal binding protein n=1 Tax=Pseudonocardia sp. TMWB2A TaxID=687430 RepID=UPI00307D0F3A
MTAVPTVVVTDYEFPDLELERTLVEDAGLRFVAARTRTPDEIVAACAGADGIINQYAQLTADVIARLPRTRVISRYGIGLNTIDVDAATQAGILVTNVPDGSLDDVSDHAAAMILGLARGLGRQDRSMRAGGWDYAASGPLYRLRDRVLGLVGFGRIPQRLAVKMQAFGMRVLATDPHADASAAAAAGVELVEPGELYRRADVVSVHAPLTPETSGMVDAAAFAAMKPTTYLVNTARGPVVDEAALVEALRTGRIAGAGLDVFESEPLAADHPLRGLDSVLLSPHCAWYSVDSEAEIRTKTTQNVIDVLTGRLPAYPVNRPETPRAATAGG